MSTVQTTSTAVRRLISILAMLAALAIFLTLYFFKYVPEQKNDYNKRAFIELKSVTDAFAGRDLAYQQVVKWNHVRSKPQPAATQAAALEADASDQWKIVYPLAQSADTQSIGLDSLMHLLTDGDRDIFDTYLMILQSDTVRTSRHSGQNTLPSEGEIVFNAGDLSMDYQVDMDTLLKKSDGFSTMDIHQVRIEGNDYKLFLYPFHFHEQRVIMAGLIGLRRYTSTYESVPIDLLTTGGILVLLLLIAIPLLKIYIIGSGERITTFDLRMIIGTYFIGGLAIFFLFAWNFLGGVHRAADKTALSVLALQLEQNLTREIDTAYQQLGIYDGIYHRHPDLRNLLEDSIYESARLNAEDSIHPQRYRQFDDLFWINDTGIWVARWGLKKYDKLPLIDVGDRQYFQNMKGGEVLLLRQRKDSFCLEPTLSKLEGKFVVTIVRRSAGDPAGTKHPIMLGLSGTMYSVCNTVLPPGYGFAIIDKTGKILFNDRMDRTLLSNIYNEFPDKSTIRQYIEYRQARFYPSTVLHGGDVALLTTPFQRLPFTVLVYCDLNGDQHFQLHLLTLTCFFVAASIFLLILAAYCNEWARTKASLTSLRLVNFEWLRPLPAKAGYYGHLLGSMLGLAAVYILAWVVVESFVHSHEFYLLAISVLLPFYLSILYFLLREKQKSLDRSLPKRPIPIAALFIPLLVILTVSIYLLFSDLHSWNKAMIVGTQLIFVALIRQSLRSFSAKANTYSHEKMLKRYVNVVVTGVFLTVVLPALAIFCFFFKEETRTRNKQEKLALAQLICQRKDAITREKADYNFQDTSSADKAFLSELKLVKGIYIPDLPGANGTPNSADAIPAHPPELYYQLRNFLFPGDTTALTFGKTPEKAGDSSWYFARESDSEVLRHVASWNRDGSPVRLALAHETRFTALQLLFGSAGKLSATNILLSLLTVCALFWLLRRLTASLASRIFLIGLFDKYPKAVCHNDILAATTPIAGITPWTADGIRQYEAADPDYRVLYVQAELKEVYKKIWDGLTSREKFVAYDFAIDSLANYKAGLPLYSLIRKGVLCLDKDDQLRFLTLSLHNFVLNQAGDKSIVIQMKKAREQGSWQNFRTPLFLIVAAAGIFVFLTQDAIYQKITGLLTSISSLVPLITQYFSKPDK